MGSGGYSGGSQMKTTVLIGTLVAASTALALDAPKRLTSNDLSVETHKWDGKAIQVNAQCFYADTDEYRCAVLGANGVPGAGSFVRIDFGKISPPEMKKAIEDNCDTLEKMPTRACRFQIVFTYSMYSRTENNDGSELMTIMPEDFAGTFSKVR